MEKIENKPVVSIVLPVYNGEKYLDSAIESCLAQAFKDFELIIVDDKSSDDSYEIMAKWAKIDSRIRIIRNNPNKKLPASLNIGFTEAKGDYFTWTSHDNLLQPNFLETMLKEIQKNQADIVYSDYIAIGENGQDIQICKMVEPKDFPLTGGIGASFMYKRGVHEALRGFETSLFLLEDYDFWVRAYLMGFKYSHLTETPYRYRWHGSSLTELSKPKIVSATAKYRYDLRKKIKLDKQKSISMRIGLLEEGRHVLSLPQKLGLLAEILVAKIKRDPS